MKETMKKLEKAGYRLHPKKCEFFKEEAEWGGTPNRSKWDQTITRQTGSDNIETYKKREKDEIFSESNPIPFKVYPKPFSANGYSQKTIQTK